MYYPFFLAYILTGVFIGGIVFYWAVKTGQFSEQQRARFLALEDDRSQPVPGSLKPGFEMYCIFFLAACAIAASLALTGYAIFFH